MYLSQQKKELPDHYYNITKHISFAYSLCYPNMGHPEIKLLRDRDVLWYALNLSQTNGGTPCAALSNFHILMQRAKFSCLMPGKLLRLMFSTTYSGITETTSFGWSLREFTCQNNCIFCSSHQTSAARVCIWLQIYILLSAGSHTPQWHPVIWKSSPYFLSEGVILQLA